MYRRQRDHSRVTNENIGGRILPMAYGVKIFPGTSREKEIDIIKREAKRLQGTGIAIIVYHQEAYLEKSQEMEDSTRSQEDDLSR